jgi:glycosyltransferase involved in cell wall biosynthesis
MRARNARGTLAVAIESILAQTFEDFELLIVDDASPDQTADVARAITTRDRRVRLVRSDTQLGVAGAANLGLREARGDYVAIMDADDWSLPDRLARQVAFLDAHRHVVICGGAIEVCDSELRSVLPRRYHLDDAAIRARLFRYSPFAHPAVIFRLDAAREVGGYRTELDRGAEDYDLYFRLGRVGAFANLPATVLKLRTSPDSFSRRHARAIELATIGIRWRAIREYGYRPGLLDVAYSLGQLVTVLMPVSWRFWTFAWLRSRTRIKRTSEARA